MTEVQRAMQILGRDIMQMSRRSVRDHLGDPQRHLLVGDQGLMEFTRGGWRNPLQSKRSDLQRVAYLVEDETLYRAYWPMLDRGPDTEPVRQELLTGVTEIEFFALDASANEYSFWPQEGFGGSENPSQQLAGIVLRLEIAPFGIVERVWEVPAS